MRTAKSANFEYETCMFIKLGIGIMVGEYLYNINFYPIQQYYKLNCDKWVSWINNIGVVTILFVILLKSLI